MRAPYATPADPYGSAIDLDRLVARLKATPAIGFFTKLALRSDVLDLRRRIEHARAAGERGRIAHTLRREFDGLVLKILALLDEDPALARDIYRAREAIWHSLVADARSGG
ncbi:MAG: hypothetical protein D6682_00915 [Zetaproteobacteria bacterium]|nr:MAG: hypothetical protein D6682_00915 [Zetaproteobacteria bacterium]